MVRVLHITADYPDAFQSQKTHAVQNLLKGTATVLDHSIYSINRQNGLGGIGVVNRSTEVTTLTYRAPPYGLLLETFLDPVADWIARDIQKQNKTIDIIHAHKLTIEGLAARRVAHKLGCPYICTLRGNTDRKYLRTKPEKRLTYRAVASNAAQLLPVTPWIERYVVRKLALQSRRVTLLPTFSDIDGFISPAFSRKEFVTAFHLDHWRLKGMPNLFSAIARLKKEGVNIVLDIIGSGSEMSTKALMKEIHVRGVEDRVKLRGSVPHFQMPGVLNRYAAFVLPTQVETFGMVYMEALFSGVPILYSENRGIDGYFDNQDIGVRCNPESVTSIARSLLALHERADKLKLSIQELQRDGGFERFRKSHICESYQELVLRLCAARGTGV